MVTSTICQYFYVLLPDEKPSTSRAFSERSKSKIMTPILAATLDRIGLSDRNAMYVISAVLTSAGLNLDDFTVSRQTISRARAEYREEIAQNIQSNFDLNGPLVVHWDEKLLQDLTGTDKVERLPVLVSSGANVQLLGVPKLSSGTGERQANEVCKLMNAWELSDRICAMGFDTTAANTGIEKSACTLIEKWIGRDLLWLACRHHIAEVLMTAAWEKLFPSKGPSSSIFIKFKSAWLTMDQSFDENMVDENIIEILGDETQYLIFEKPTQYSTATTRL
ncbi:uncharacterized protein LOC134216869 isoform X1 [Armigeres subalbatus]|uniref:uncharacterized protein LOC134216869 isoform X1 n=2 Tax=Armigeres subalbatus TaxID=124917 RepID=UPI002ED35E96